MASRYIVPSLDRAIDVLEILASAQVPIGLTEMCRRTKIPKSTLFRIMTTLQARGCVELDEEGSRFKLGMKVWELGDAYLRDLDLYSASLPHLKQLADDSGESVFLGILDESEVIYIQRLESAKSVTVVRKLQQRAPAHCTATGEAILAYLPEAELNRILEDHELQAFNAKTVTDRKVLESRLARVRKDGLAIVDGEYNAEVLCISAPIFDNAGRPQASATVAMISAQAAGNQARLDEVGRFVRDAARRISRDLGYVQTPRKDDVVLSM